MKKIKLLVSNKCCGKTTLSKLNQNYIDFDFFSKHFNEIPNVKKIMLYALDTVADDENKVIMLNYSWHHYFDEFKKHFDLDVTCFVPEPSEESRNFRIEMEKKRDVEKFGVFKKFTIQKQFESFVKRNECFLEWAKENGFKTVVLKAGEFIGDFI